MLKQNDDDSKTKQYTNSNDVDKSKVYDDKTKVYPQSKKDILK